MDQSSGGPSAPLKAGITRGAALSTFRHALAAAGLPTPGLDARVLVSAALNLAPSALLTRPELPLDEAEAAEVSAYAHRRLRREPVARIIGQAEFWGLPFRLSPETLVPRPDTETVVEAALASAADRNAALRILDLGTGSGCILVALLRELPNAFGLGVDRSPGALATARHNAMANGAGARSAFVASDWGAALDRPFDLVVSNPPYIRGHDIAALEPEVSRYDPLAALDGGSDGLAAYRIILADAGRLLSEDGLMVLEVGYDQADDVAALAIGSGFSYVQARRDLGGHTRALTLSRRSDGVVFGG